MKGTTPAKCTIDAVSTTTGSNLVNGLPPDLHRAVSCLSDLLQTAASAVVALNVDVPGSWCHMLRRLQRQFDELTAVQSVYIHLDSGDDYEGEDDIHAYDLLFAGCWHALKALTRLEIDCSLPEGVSNELEADLPRLTNLQVLKLPGFMNRENMLCRSVACMQQLTYLDADAILGLSNGSEWEDFGSTVPDAAAAA